MRLRPDTLRSVTIEICWFDVPNTWVPNNGVAITKPTHESTRNDLIALSTQVPEYRDHLVNELAPGKDLTDFIPQAAFNAVTGIVQPFTSAENLETLVLCAWFVRKFVSCPRMKQRGRPASNTRALIPTLCQFGLVANLPSPPNNNSLFFCRRRD